MTPDKSDSFDSLPELAPRSSGGAYAGAAALCALATVLASVMRAMLAESNLVLIYLLAVVIATVRFGRGPGILASLLAVLAFDVFLVEPLYSLHVADSQYLLTFAIMLIVSLIVSHLTANLQLQATIAQMRATRAEVQYEMSKDLAGAITIKQISTIAEQHVARAFHGRGAILLADRSGALDCTALSALPGLGKGAACDMARAIYERDQQGDSEDAVSAAGSLHVIALRAPMRVRGVLVLCNGQCHTQEHRQLLQTFAAQIALAVERVHYVDVASETAIAMESERLRNSLLSAVSHDIRTPLAAIVGLSSTLATSSSLGPETVRALAQDIADDAFRMNELVTNLLDMARLQTGGVHLNRQWQLVEEVIGSALAASAKLLASTEVELALPAHMPLLEYDAVLLERVLCNLLENAVRHGGAGRWIGIGAVTGATELRLSVTDRGPGIPPEARERIFDKFVHGTDRSSREGAGLGLAICATIVAAHGGRIWAEDGAGGGASFIVTLPLGSPPDLSRIVAEEPA